MSRGRIAPSLFSMWKRRKTTEQFIVEARLIHGNKYQYPNMYETTSTCITIVCPLHGEFLQRPYNHLRGTECPKCGWDAASKRFRFTKKQFVNRATIIHKNKYNYDNFVYVNARTQGTIICPVHGSFQQRPAEHVYKGAGCQSCKRDKLRGRYTESYFQCNKKKRHQKGWFYGVLLPDVDGTLFVKIGITSQPLYYRLSQYGNHNLLFSKCLLLHNAFKLEQTLLKTLSKHRYAPQRHFAGHTECFIHSTEVVRTLEESRS